MCLSSGYKTGGETVERKDMEQLTILEKRKGQVFTKGSDSFAIECEKNSLEGSVSQRACVFCGSRVVLYPIADALHLVHGPVGCAVYTWDIRGSISSGPDLYRKSFSTDLREKDVIYGGEKKLYSSLKELIAEHSPKAAFIYSTCIVGIIGDDVNAVCRRVEAEEKIPVIPVHSEGFRGTKKDGYKAACDALFGLMDRHEAVHGRPETQPLSINILGEFNLAGEAWMIREYYRKMGINIVSVMTGDGRVDEISASPAAALNVVQCSGSMTNLAKMMEGKYGIPYIRVSYFGLEDTAQALYDVAFFFGKADVIAKTKQLVQEEIAPIMEEVNLCRSRLEGRRAAIYVGGAFKAFSLIKALALLGMEVVLVGSQTGSNEDYQLLEKMCRPGTVIVDDSNPVELSRIMMEKGADLFIGGVKERPMALKLGVAFCDHNHERKTALAGFEGMLNFAREVHNSVLSPVWKFARRKPFSGGVS